MDHIKLASACTHQSLALVLLHRQIEALLDTKPSKRKFDGAQLTNMSHVLRRAAEFADSMAVLLDEMHAAAPSCPNIKPGVRCKEPDCRYCRVPPRRLKKVSR